MRTGYKLHTREQPEYLTLERGFATPRQMAAFVDQQIGGWPVAAFTLYMFQGKNYTTGNAEILIAFADERGQSLDGNRDYSKSQSWQRAMTRDDYYLMRLSPDAFHSMKAAIRIEIKQEIVSRL